MIDRLAAALQRLTGLSLLLVVAPALVVMVLSVLMAFISEAVPDVVGALALPLLLAVAWKLGWLRELWRFVAGGRR